MISACSEFVVQSSNFEDLNSSEEESAPVKLSSSKIKASLKDISSFKEHNESIVSFKVKKRRSSCRDEKSNDSLSSSPKIKKILTSKCNPAKQNQMIKNSSISHENSRKNLSEDEINKKHHSIESSGDKDISKESFVSFEVRKKRSSCCDEESNDSLSSSPKIKKILISKCKPVKLNQMIKNSSISHENSMKSINEDKMNKKGSAICFLVFFLTCKCYFNIF
nr:uncharacterized protein LOC105847023 isoform X3 [Hydra vulgaris]XP_047125159.1 uncharacterized protein LOC105847023 isoform X3 [Hydra vulgaris]